MDNDSAVIREIGEKFVYINEIPLAVGIIDMSANVILKHNDKFAGMLKIKDNDGIKKLDDFTVYSFSDIAKQMEITKNNELHTNTMMIPICDKDKNPLSAEIIIKGTESIKGDIAVMIIKEMADNHAAEEANRKAFENIYEKMPILVFIHNIEENSVIYTNKYTKKLLKTEDDEEMMKKLSIGNNKSGENKSYEKMISGVWFQVSETIMPKSDGTHINIVVGADVTKNKKEEQKQNTSVDSATGTFNRIAGFNCVKDNLERCSMYGGMFSICYLGLNDLKKVNDLHGREAGDKYLRALSEVVKSVVRKSDMIARMGGDEFIIVLQECPEVTSQRIMGTINERLGEMSSKLYNDCVYSISYGVITINEENMMNVEDLMETVERKIYDLRM
ncbi:MAG: GGDEF domain-containing protein [Firmicutes bacterium]|nr:GGDEF domain-containing protein [Bacillota bacterium]